MLNRRSWRQALRLSKRRPLVLFVLCGFWAAVFAVLAGPLPIGPAELAELSLQDAVVRHGERTGTPEDLVFLAVDEASLDLSQLEPEEIGASPVLSMMARGFPWSRAVYAGIIDKLLAAGAKAVVLDVHFPSRGEGDAELRETLARHYGRVVVASLFDDSGVGGGHSGSQYRPPADSILPADLSAVSLTGFANFWPDIDRKVRVAHYRITDADLVGGAGAGGEPRLSLAAASLAKSEPDVRLPPAGLMRFCAPGSFFTVPVWSIFVPDIWRANLRDGMIFRDKIVLLGPLASRFRDHFRTPLGTLPGPEIHLHALAAGLADSFYRRATPAAVMWSCAAMGLLAFLLTWMLRRPLAALGVLALLLCAYAGLAVALFNLAGLVPGLLYPCATLVAAGLTSFAYDFSLERRERARVRRSLERYVSRDVVRELLDHENDLLAQLGGARKDVAVLFSDLRGFTKLAENADPANLVSGLNEYLGAMVEIVFRHGGTLDKFIGDAVMAVWGTVNSAGPREDAIRAVRTALDMLAATDKLSAAWSARGASGLNVGIGIHCGPAIFGNIGSELKMEPTVIGDTVNLTSRLESLTKRYNVPLVASQEVAEAAAGAFLFRTLETVRVVGRASPVTLYTVVAGADVADGEPAWLRANEEGWSHYRGRRFAGAAACFETAAAAIPGDSVLAHMAARCRKLQIQPPGAEWEPVVNMESK